MFQIIAQIGSGVVLAAAIVHYAVYAPPADPRMKRTVLAILADGKSRSGGILFHELSVHWKGDPHPSVLHASIQELEDDGYITSRPLSADGDSPADREQQWYVLTAKGCLAWREGHTLA